MRSQLLVLLLSFAPVAAHAQSLLPADAPVTHPLGTTSSWTDNLGLGLVIGGSGAFVVAYAVPLLIGAFTLLLTALFWNGSILSEALPLCIPVVGPFLHTAAFPTTDPLLLADGLLQITGLALGGLGAVIRWGPLHVRPTFMEGQAGLAVEANF